MMISLEWMGGSGGIGHEGPRRDVQKGRGGSATAFPAKSFDAQSMGRQGLRQGSAPRLAGRLAKRGEVVAWIRAVTLPAPAEIAASFCDSLVRAARYDAPYPHLYAEGLFPEPDGRGFGGSALAGPRRVPTSGQARGQCARIFFGASEMARFPVMRALAEALQSGPVTIRRISRLCAAPIDRLSSAARICDRHRRLLARASYGHRCEEIHLLDFIGR